MCIQKVRFTQLGWIRKKSKRFWRGFDRQKCSLMDDCSFIYTSTWFTKYKYYRTGNIFTAQKWKLNETNSRKNKGETRNKPQEKPRKNQVALWPSTSLLLKLEQPIFHMAYLIFSVKLHWGNQSIYITSHCSSIPPEGVDTSWHFG